MNRPPRSSRRWLWFSVLLFVCLLFVFVRDSLQVATSYVIYPFYVAQASVTRPISNCYQQWSSERQSYAALTAKHQKLKNEHSELQSEYTRLQATIDRFMGMRELELFRKAHKQNGHIARVIQKTFTPYEHSMILDAGTQEGVEQGMVVVSGNNLVGQVIEAYPWYSRMRLLTDSRCRVAGFCAKTKSPGIYTGLSDTRSALLEHVDRLKKVRTGDTVLSSGEGLLFPRGLALGRIAKIGSDGVCHTIDVEPLIDVEQLEYCLILRK